MLLRGREEGEEGEKGEEGEEEEERVVEEAESRCEGRTVGFLAPQNNVQCTVLL